MCVGVSQPDSCLQKMTPQMQATPSISVVSPAVRIKLDDAPVAVVVVEVVEVVVVAVVAGLVAHLPALSSHVVKATDYHNDNERMMSPNPLLLALTCQRQMMKTGGNSPSFPLKTNDEDRSGNSPSFPLKTNDED